jgi:hypothetical protein
MLYMMPNAAGWCLHQLILEVANCQLFHMAGTGKKLCMM